MKPPVLLALTSHGNAPYLMVTRLARALGNVQVVIPDYYGDPQRKILMEEMPGCESQVYLSRELGELLSPLLLEGESGKSFSEFGENLADPANPKSITAIENSLGALLRNGFAAISMDGRSSSRFSLSDFAGVLNTTLPLRVNLPVHVFFFTAWMSDLYGILPQGDVSKESKEALEKLETFADLWRRVESTYSHSFIPRIHALSYRKDKIKGVIHTPPLAFKRPIVNKLQQKSILFIPSGTRTDVHSLNRLAKQLPERYHRLVLGHLRNHGDFSAEQFSRVNGSVFGDTNLSGVVARGGWGTIWECLANIKPLAVSRMTYAEDPEMGHTQVTLEKVGLGLVVDGSILPFLEPDRLQQISQSIQQVREEDKQIFGSWADDGIGFIAHTLRSLLPNWMPNAS